MKSIRIDMHEDTWLSVEESVAIEPMKAGKCFVDLQIYHCVYKGRSGQTTSQIVRFYFDGRDPEIQ